MQRFDIAFVIEQALGHVTHGKNLYEVVQKDAEVAGHWILPNGKENSGLNRIPIFRNNWTVRAGLQTRKGLAALRHRVEPDAIFFHTQVTAMLAPDWAARYPSVISLDATPHQYDRFGEFYGHEVGPALVEQLKWRLHKYVLGRANHLVTWSQWTKDGLIEEYEFEDRDITVIPPGVDAGWWQRPMAVGLAVNEERPVRILFVGGDFLRKGGDILLAAVRTLRAEGLPVELHLVTRSPVAQSPGIFVYDDMQPNSDALRALFHESDLFCLPTQGEGLPMVLLEAGAAGLPLVATGVGAISEVLHEGITGLTVPAGDAPALAAALRGLVINPALRSAMGAAAAKLVNQNYNAATNGRRLLELLKEAARSSQRQPQTARASTVLLTVSGEIPTDIISQLDNGRRPLPDYMALAADFSADLIDYPMARLASGSFGRLLETLLGKNLMLAWACFRQRQYQVFFTDGENVGILLTILLKFLGPILNRGRTRPRHLMIAHWLSVPKKRILFDLLHLETHVDIFIVYSTWQKQFIEKRWRIPDERVIFTPFMVDAQFFSPGQVDSTKLIPHDIPQNGRPLICAVGLELRDYLTLVNAVRGLDIDVVIAADSPWSKRQDAGKFGSVPENVHLSRYSWPDLRLLYATSAFVVVPLYNVTFQAGITTILEAMAMGKAVICSRTPGQSDVIVDGVTGLYVVPEDADAMREAINCLVAQPELAEKIGRAARQQIETFIDLPLYSRRLADQVAEQLR